MTQKIKVDKIRIDFVVGVISILVFSIIFIFDCTNVIEHQIIQYDEGYNATVAANVMRYGEYRVSYPSNIIFYNIISTGETVILPTALLFKLFGINAVTSSIISVIYALGCIWATWWLFFRCMKDYISCSSTISAIGTIILISSDGLFQYISTHLIGEGASLLFILIGLIQIKKYYDKKKNNSLFWTGVLTIASFLTKTSMIFILVSITGIIVIDVFIIKKITLPGLGSYLLGLVCGFIVLELYKLIQLGSVNNYFNWWSNEWQNMLSQSSGIDASYSISFKIKYLESIFAGCNLYICIAFLVFPVMYWLWNSICIKRRTCNEKSGLRIIAFGGICGSSMIIYFILLGGEGLVYARRHEVNQFLVRLFIVFFALMTIAYVIKKIFEKNWLLSFGGIILAVLIFISVAPISVIKTNWTNYISKEEKDTYPAELMHEFLREIENLPDDAVLYVAGWWQEPNVTLYLDRPMKNIYSVMHGEEQLAENAFFIVGDFLNDINIGEIEGNVGAEVVRYDTSEVDYKKKGESFNRQDFENFAIYRIIKNNIGN